MVGRDFAAERETRSSYAWELQVDVGFHMQLGSDPEARLRALKEVVETFAEHFAGKPRLGGAADAALVRFETTTDVFSLEHAVRAGAFPQVQFASAYLERALLRYGDDDLIARVPDLELHGMEWADSYVGLRGARNPLAPGPRDAFRPTA